MNQTESIKAYLEEKASKHKIAYTDIDKYQELIEGYFEFINPIDKCCLNCKHYALEEDSEPCKFCLIDLSLPNWQPNRQKS